MRDLLFVVDPAGDTFRTLREADLDMSLWRGEVGGLPPEEAQLAIVAVPAARWQDVAQISAILPTIVIARPTSEEDAQRALESGAIGYVDGTLEASSIARAVSAALRGEVVFSRRVLANAIRGTATSRIRSIGALTPRQRQVLALISRGATDKQIAATLGIAPSTAQKHASNLVRRLGVPNRAAAVANAAV